MYPDLQIQKVFMPCVNIFYVKYIIQVSTT